MIEFIKSERAEGQLLIAAMAILTTEGKRRKKTPDQVLEELIRLQSFMFPQNVLNLDNRESEYEILRMLSLEREVATLQTKVRQGMEENDRLGGSNNNLRAELSKARDRINFLERKLDAIAEQEKIDQSDIEQYIRTVENLQPDEKVSFKHMTNVIKKMMEQLEKVDFKLEVCGEKIAKILIPKQRPMKPERPKGRAAK